MDLFYVIIFLSFLNQFIQNIVSFVSNNTENMSFLINTIQNNAFLSDNQSGTWLFRRRQQQLEKHKRNDERIVDDINDWWMGEIRKTAAKN